MILKLLLVLGTVSLASAQPRKCDQTPPHTTSPPTEDKGLFHLSIVNSIYNENGQVWFNPLQTYVLSLDTTNTSRPFRWFMITAEDPEVDNNLYNFAHKPAKVGTLTMLNTGQSRHSERCANTIESYDNTVKTHIEIHWKSPEDTDEVRIRAMVAENKETWYTGENLTITLVKQLQMSKDSPPIQPNPTCNLCSEARYEVIFTGKWSRLTHHRYYPTKPDENGYSHLVGASHDFDYVMWQAGSPASPGMQKLAEYTNTDLLEREIIGNMSVEGGTRTLIRGKRRHHPHMHEPSHALFRVDSIHHLFSIAVGMTPSPDWFLGTTRFELCTASGWLESYKMPLYPWDAGTMDGVSYEENETGALVFMDFQIHRQIADNSQRSVTQPVNNIQRVEVGSFNEDSPFYQLNLNDLKPFAYLEVNRLDVYELDPSECEGLVQEAEEEGDDEEETPQDEPEEGPRIAESRQRDAGCVGEWGEWSPCTPYEGVCGRGGQTRARQTARYGYKNEEFQLRSPNGSCPADEDPSPIEFRLCFVEC